MAKVIEPGTGVYWIDSYYNLQMGVAGKTVMENVRGEEIPYLRIRQGKNLGASTGAKLEDCYFTKEECLAAENKRFAAKVAEYRKEINTVEELAQFMYDHNLNTEFPDLEARQAAHESGKELMGLDLQGNKGTVNWSNWYDEEIDSPERLMQFMYDSDLSGEFGDYSWRDGAKKYAKEILGYEMQEEDDFTKAVESLNTQDMSMNK